MSPRDRLADFDKVRGLDHGHGSGTPDAFDRSDADAVRDIATAAAATRAAQLTEFRRRQAAESSVPPVPIGAGATGTATTASLAPVSGSPNWIPLGPAGVLSGQTSTQPVVSGRIPSLALSDDGRRIYAASANGGVWRSTDAGRSWTAMSDEFDEDPTRRHVDSLACGAIALVDGGSADQDRLYVGTGEQTGYFGVGMLMSPDGGRTWVREDTSPSSGRLLGRTVYEIAIDPVDPDNVVTATSRGLYRRTLVSGNWRWVAAIHPAPPLPEPGSPPRPPRHDVTSVVAHHRDGTTTFYAVKRRGDVARSTSSAGSPHSSWTQTAAPAAALTGFPSTDTGRMTLAVSSDGVSLYALVANVKTDHLLGVWRIDIGGTPAATAWTQVTGVPQSLFGSNPDRNGQGFYDQAIVVDPADADRFYVGGSGNGTGAFIHRCEIPAVEPGASVAYAASATSIGPSCHADVHSFVISKADHSLWVGCDGGVFVALQPATGSGAFFQARNSGLSTMTLQGLAHHPDLPGYAFCGAQDNGGMRYSAEEVWTGQLSGDGGATVINWATPTQIINGYIHADIRQFESDGSRWSTTSRGDVSDDDSEFYPPIVGMPKPPGTPTNDDRQQATRVAWGGTRVYINDDFGDSGAWERIPPDASVFPPLAPGQERWAKAQSLAFTRHTHLFCGLVNGTLWEYDYYDGEWTKDARGAPFAGAEAITSIAPDLAIPTGRTEPSKTAAYVTVGGAGTRSVWHFDSSRPAGTEWQDRSGTGGTPLLRTHHSAIVVDPAAPQRLWVAGDIGVWQSIDAGANWTPFSNNLPDAAVLELDLHPVEPRMLRASTHGRGVFEIPVDGTPQPDIELTIRTNLMDTSRGDAPTSTTKSPLDRSRSLGPNQSPDICTDPPDETGRLIVDPNAIDAVAMTRDLAPLDRRILANVADAPSATTKVHVRVRNRGHVIADDVQVMLLLGRKDDLRVALPVGYAADVAAGTPIATDNWTTVGVRTIDGVGGGKAGIATFDLPSSLLAPSDVSDGHKLPLLALVSHPGDIYDADQRDPDLLALGERRAAMVTAVVVQAAGAAAQGIVSAPLATAGPGGAGSGGGSANSARVGDAPPRPSRLTPAATTLLAHARLGDVVDGISGKVNTARVTAARAGLPHTALASRTEHQVLALAKRANAMFAAGPTVPAASTRAGAETGTFALLGSAGFDVAANVSLFSPGGRWIVETMRRGTPDLHRSLVSVPACELVLDIAAKAKLETTNADEVASVDAFAMGMLAASASEIVVNPVLADLLAKDTNLDWNHEIASRGAAVVDRLIVERVFGLPVGSDLAGWWPAVDEVPGAIWTGFQKSLENKLGLPDGRPKGFAEFEADFDSKLGGDWITEVRLRNAYSLWRGDLSMGSMSWTGWWGWASMFTLASPVALLICKALDSGRSVFEPGVPFDERAAFDVLMSGMGVGSVGPFVSSMALWSAIDEHTEPFVNALLLFLSRAALAGAAWGTNADDLSPGARWGGMFAPMAGTDVYAAIRALAASGRPPGDSYVFAMQTASSVNGLLTLAIGAIMHEIAEESGEEGLAWLAWAIHTLGMFFGVGIPVGFALESGGGWRRWFLEDGPAAGLSASLESAGRDAPEPTAMARTFDESTLWTDPQTAPPAAPAGPDIQHRALPSGMRGLVKIWKQQGDLDVNHDGDGIHLRVGGAAPVEVRVPYAGLTASELATSIGAAGVADLHVEVVGTDDPDYRLAAPETLDDPGDRGAVRDHVVVSASYVGVGEDEDHAYVIGHAPRAALSTRQGIHGASRSELDEFAVVPLATSGDLESTALGASADLAVLLALGAVPSLSGGTVDIDASEWATRFGANGQQVREIHQVFRRWNLAERRSNEWNQLITGGARSEKRGDATVTDTLTRPYTGTRTSPAADGAAFADAMGWIPLWRTWLRIATDAGVDADANTTMPFTPVTTLANGTQRRLTNAELTLGVRFLLDLEA